MDQTCHKLSFLFPFQVITIDLRSTQCCGGLGVTLPENVDTKSKDCPAELSYVKMLNRVLPLDIRILDWAPAAEGFSARFDCRSRTYRYYFPRGSLVVALMAEAAKRSAEMTQNDKTLVSSALFLNILIQNLTSVLNRYEGTHDFRNLCKMDVGNGVLQFERTILSAMIEPVHPEPESRTDEYDLFVFEIKGLAFLYHQVSKMILLLSRNLTSDSFKTSTFICKRVFILFFSAGTLHDGSSVFDWTEAGISRYN